MLGLTFWQTTQWHPNGEVPGDRVELCMRRQRVQVEPLLQPEVRKICECFVGQIEQNMTVREKGIVDQLIADDSSSNIDRLVEGMSLPEMKQTTDRVRAIMQHCAPLTVRKTAS